MKLNRLETHDRLLTFKKDQEANIFQGADDCLKRNPLSLSLQDYSPYVYLFAHPRTAEDGVTKVMYWQPRLTKPTPQTNSYLFRAKSHSDIIEVCWILPDEMMWSQYDKGKVTENELVLWCIDQYKNNRYNMGKPEPDDLPDEKIDMIYRQIKADTSSKQLLNRLYDMD